MIDWLVKKLNKKVRYFAADFETTVYEGQERTDVWASASVELYTEDVRIFHSISNQFDYFCNLKGNLFVYYHNLKFDGSFWLDFLMIELGYKLAKRTDKDTGDITWLKDKDMPPKTIKCNISDRGQFYTLTIKTRSRQVIELRDSLKLLPFSLKKLGEDFDTKHKKLEMEYEGVRYPGCNITKEEKAYIENDVLVLKEALEVMFDDGHNKLTIGACCLSEYKRTIGKDEYKLLFPDLTEIEAPEYTHTKTADEYIRRSYKGGWCYVAKGKQGKIYKNGLTADVNSLYPSMMSSESGNKYPVGYPVFWNGDIPDIAKSEYSYFFVRIRTRFYLKDGFLPFIQIKNDFRYLGTECLETSDVYDPSTNKYYRYTQKSNGDIVDTRVTLTLTETDYKLFLEHYNVEDFEVLDGCYFESMSGIFDDYINHYRKIKMESKGVKRTIAKLFLNNLYGKMASSKVSSFKIPVIKEDKTIGYVSQLAFDKKAGYIAVGSAITSFARCFTITAAQQNYYGEDERGFIYADTDSIHCDLELNELIGVPIHPTQFNHWSIESEWDEAIFTRQKTYIEHVTSENKPFYDVKCAGMPDRCKNLFIASLTGEYEFTGKETQEEKEFLSKERTLSDFTKGLKVPGKLRPKRIQGGILLTECPYEMR